MTRDAGHHGAQRAASLALPEERIARGAAGH